MYLQYETDDYCEWYCWQAAVMSSTLQLINVELRKNDRIAALIDGLVTYSEK